jgi:hypothetical protein
MALATRDASLVDRADVERLFTRMQERIVDAWRAWRRVPPQSWPNGWGSIMTAPTT